MAPSSFGPEIVPAIQLATMAITIVSAYFVSRQQARTYGHTRNFLALVHVFFLAVVVLEFLRNFYSSPGFITIYTEGATTFILIDVVLLTLVAASFYYRPSAQGGGSPLLGLLKRKWHALAFAAFMAYVALAETYLFAYQPFTSSEITNIAGVTLYDTVFDASYVDLLFLVLVLFALYPSMLLLLSRRRTNDKGVRRALLILPICWGAIGLEFLIFNGYLLIIGIDASSLGYLIGATVFLITARTFRQATTFATLFATVAAVPATSAVSTFSSKLGVAQGFSEGRLMLFETSSSTDFEEAVLNFIREVVSGGSTAFVFTSKGSPVYDTVSKEAGVRVYVFSSSVSYPKETEKRDEILVPANDIPILLDVMSKFVSVNPGAKIAIVFDSLSDVVLSQGVQECYKFVRQASAILNLPNISSLFLLTLGAHDDQTVSLVKSLFPNHLLLDQSGLKITRSGPKA
ncbi:MAG: hypothetical protein JRN06_02970 [Nitrososphaerota archaeon]|nr:hypothetical protein [Nitrososphaerota archaeon]MDG7023180.1 hypothetical protein [Nitrososphaerota archaeon]